MKKIIYILGIVSILLIPLVTYAVTYPDGCTATTKYSATTGKLCSNLPQNDCSPGDTYSSLTGQLCSSYILGCVSTSGFSIVNGKKCDGSVSVSQTDSQPIQENITAINHTNQAIAEQTQECHDKYDNDIAQINLSEQNLNIEYQQTLLNEQNIEASNGSAFSGSGNLAQQQITDEFNNQMNYDNSTLELYKTELQECLNK